MLSAVGLLVVGGAVLSAVVLLVVGGAVLSAVVLLVVGGAVLSAVVLLVVGGAVLSAVVLLVVGGAVLSAVAGNDTVLLMEGERPTASCTLTSGGVSTSFLMAFSLDLCEEYNTAMCVKDVLKLT